MKRDTMIEDNLLVEVQKYKGFLEMEEKAPATVEKYVRDLKAFIRFIDGRVLTKEIVIEYKQFLFDKNYMVRSINSIIAALNGFLSFVGRPECKLKSVRIQRQLYCAKEKELLKSEYVRLINAAKEKDNERLNLIIQTICGTGMRVGELKFITVDAVKKGVAVVSLKGKTRMVFIVKELQRKLVKYIQKNNISKGNVFVTRSGKPMDRINIWREMKSLCLRANVNSAKVFPHNLRHLFAKTFYSIEKDIAKLADVLGHSSINTTRIYIVTTGDEHRRQMEKLGLII